MELSTLADIGVALATLFLAIITSLTIRETRLQQKKDRLHKEMTLLVGQLHIHMDSDLLFGTTELNNRPNRDRTTDQDWKMYFNFWDNIEINMYLADRDLLRALKNHIDAKNDYWNWARSNGLLIFNANNEYKQKMQWIKTTRNALDKETNRRYENLKKEIDELEQRPWYHFWKCH